ncbi:hypothetical protein SAMN05216412_1137 [Nitrosospira multiformis]|uniref:Uncharacterized protein n=1 Tax=Nitrosospira multiformis TaxID=1231 RepID=A0A1I0GH60_9PROT|nr:hypothetical protein SAMN05216412_1137 [Nitrosospira multiformis]
MRNSTLLTKSPGLATALVFFEADAVLQYLRRAFNNSEVIYLPPGMDPKPDCTPKGSFVCYRTDLRVRAT